MQCNKCSSKMTLLFMSYVCDTCEPPKNSFEAKAVDNENGFKYYVLWYDEVEDPSGWWSYFHRENLFEHDLSCVVRQSHSERVFEIHSKNKIPFDRYVILDFGAGAHPIPKVISKNGFTFQVKVMGEVTDQVEIGENDP